MNYLYLFTGQQSLCLIGNPAKNNASSRWYKWIIACRMTASDN